MAGTTTVSTTHPRGIALSLRGLVQLVRAVAHAMRLHAGLDVPASGEVSALAPTGQPPRTIGSTPVMPAALHDTWCGWPEQVRHPTRARVVHCAGCTLYVELDEAGPAGGAVPRARPPR